MENDTIIGWDLGGAHLKAAALDGTGKLTAAVQEPCPLWKGLDKLESAMTKALGGLHKTDRHAVTMTGELSDLFDDRTEGVRQIADTITKVLPTGRVLVYGGRAGFVALSGALENAENVASSNWLASATMAARMFKGGLYVDMGSTTTDIVAFAGGEVCARGYNDHQRMEAEELVYTGLTRTPVLALADERIALMAEIFATSADVYRLIGVLPEEADLHPAADGKGKTQLDSARRLARMVGRDVEDSDLAPWRRLARRFAENQMRKIHSACEFVLSQGGLDEGVPLIGAGVGYFLLPELARRLGRPYVAFPSLVHAAADLEEDRVAACAPALAVAWLARNER